MIEEVMKKDVGKTLLWKGKKIVIKNSFTCYDGDFFEYSFIDDKCNNIYRINIWTDEGRDFIKCLEKI